MIQGATGATLAGGPSMGARRTFWALVSLGGVSAALTILFLGMRVVMEIGGTCATGTPFVPRVECPDGVVPLMVGSIWGGLILVVVHGAFLTKGAPSLAFLAWPALFLSLGWNFVEYGLNPPGDRGIGWGSLISAVLFLLLGGVPVYALITSKVGGRKSAPVTPAAPSEASRHRRSADELVSQLERLGALRNSGAMTDDEFEAAKRRVLDEEGGR